MLPAELTQYKTLFLQTAWDYIRTLEANLHVLRTDPGNKEALEAVHISAHSLKSQSLVMHYEQLGAACLALERLFKALKENGQQISSETLTVLAGALEEVKKSLAEIAAHDTELSLEAVTATIEEMNGSN